MFRVAPWTDESPVARFTDLRSALVYVKALRAMDPDGKIDLHADSRAIAVFDSFGVTLGSACTPKECGDMLNILTDLATS